ncbi:MAG: BNR-repeat neuraminidase N-terminal domain-containing protein [Bacteroidota bacterium]|nr:BNR-repeat neuraminidase N-terminal domain-containing protein [Bacteroidota bacterium]
MKTFRYMFAIAVLVLLAAGVDTSLAQMSGAYTINSGQPTGGTNFQTFTAAISALTASGVSGPVTFTVAPGSGPYTEQLSIPAITGASAINTITFDGNGQTLQFSPTSANYSVIDLNGADYITFTNLNVIGLSNTYGHLFKLRNQADYIRIQNCTLDLSAITNTTSSYSSWIAASNSLTSNTTTGNNANYLTVEGNTFVGNPYYGISLYGTSTSSLCTGNTIRNNTFQNCYYYVIRLYYQTAATIDNNTIKDFYAYGIYAYYLTASTITKNEISRPTRSSITTYYGIYLSTGCAGITIAKNRLFNPCGYNPTSSTSSYGIYNSSTSATSGNEIKIVNNALYTFNGTGSQYGIYAAGTYVWVYHNTVSLDYTASTSTSTVYGIYTSATSGVGPDVKNNIVSITNGGTGTKYCLYFSGASTTTSNYNDLHMGSTAGINYIGYWNGNTAATLAVWQSYTPGYDAASKSVDPQFESPSTGNLKPGEALIDNMGTNLTGSPYNITDDITGATRSTTPDPGAWEFTPQPMTVSSVVTTQTNTSTVLRGSTNQQIIEVTVTTTGTLSPISLTQLNLSTNGSTSASDIANAKVYYTGSSPVFNTSNLFGTTVSPSGAFAVTGSQTLSAGVNYFWVTYDIASNATPCNVVDAECLSVVASAATHNANPSAPTGNRMIKAPLSGTYVIDRRLTPGCTVYTSFTDAVSDLVTLGVTGPVVFDVAAGSGPYTEHVSIAPINGVSAVNTVTFRGHGDTLQYTPTSSDVSIVDLNGCDYVIFDSLTVRTLSTTYGVGFLLRNQSDNITVRNCRIDLTALPASAGSSTAYIASSNSLTSVTQAGNTANDCTFEDNVMVGTPYYGISLNGTSTTVFCTGNTIRRNSIKVYYYAVRLYYQTGALVDSNTITDPYGYGVYCYYAPSSTVSRNDISRPTRTTSTTVYGVYVTTGCTDVTVEKNRVHNMFDLIPTNTSSTYAFYCSASGTSTAYVTFKNNLVYNIGGQGAQYGIYNSGAYVRLYHNTVALDDQGTTSAASYAVYVASTTAPGTDVKNNCITVTRSGTGAQYGLYFSGNAAVSSNYNNLYVLCPGNPQAYTGYFNGQYGGTLAQWKTVNNGAFDQNSIAVYPAYELPDSGNLRPQALALNNSGTDLFTGGFVTDDILGNPRSATPDLGAYEFTPGPMSYASSTAFQNVTSLIPIGMPDAQIIGVMVQTVGALSPISVTSMTFNTNGCTSTSDISAAKVFYTGTSPVFSTAVQFGSTVSSPSGSFTVTGSQQLEAGPNYFWLTYSISPSATPNDTVDAQCTSLTAGGSPRTPTVTDPPGFRILQPALSGSYTVGTGGNFATLTEAFTQINNLGLSGNTTLNIISNVTEPGTAALYEWVNVPPTASYRLVIQPSGGSARTVSANVSGAVIRLVGADNVVIDGLNSGGNSLTLSNTGTSTQAVVWLQSLGTGAGCREVSIRNCTVLCGSNTTTSFGILVNGTTSLSTGAYTSDNDRITIQNVNVKRALYGIWVAAASPGFNDSLTITGCTIGSATASEYIHYRAVYLEGVVTPLVTQNTITGVFDDKDGYRVVGIELGSNVVNAAITRNNITNIKGLWYDASIDDANGAFGIKSTSTTNVRNLLIANNMITDVMSLGYYDYKESQPYGIWLYGGDTVKIYYNSVYLAGTFTNYSTSAACCIYNTSVTNVDMRNNVFRNSITGPSGTYSYAIWAPASNYLFSVINNNDYYVSGANGVLGFYGSDKTTLAAWQAASGQDNASVSVDPVFVSTTNLHIASGSTASQLESGGATIPGIAIDYDGDVRPGPSGSQNGGALAPDIGADEFDGKPNDLIPPAIAVTPLDTTSSTATRTIVATITDASGVPTTGIGLPRLYWRINAGSWQFVAGVPIGGNQYQFTFGGGVATYDVVYYYIVAQDMAPTPNVGASPSAGAGGFSANPPACATPPTNPYSYAILGFISGTVSVPGTYSSLTGAGGLFDIINKSYVTGDITVNITSNLTEDGTYGLNHLRTIPPDAAYRVTIQPDAATERLISGNVTANGMIRITGADRVMIDGRYSGIGRYLRFRNIGTAHGTIYFSNDSRLDTVRNCYIESALTSTSYGTISILAGSTAGNDSIAILNNIIRERSDVVSSHTIGIYEVGTSSFLNDGITIANNEILNFSYYGIYASSTGTGNDWMVSGNSLYCDLASPPTTIAYGIYLHGSANNQQIIGNSIGGTARNCGGTPLVLPGTSTFYGIYLACGTVSPSSVQGNTIQNINFTGSSGTIYLLYTGGGSINIGGVTGNVIGHPTTANSITTSRSTTCYLMYVANTGDAVIRNNTIANVTSTHTGTSAFGALYRSGGTATDISNNAIYALTSSSGSTTTTTTTAMFGVVNTCTAANQVISGNTIYNLKNTGGTGSAVTMVQALAMTGSNAAGTISKNRIYGLENTTGGQGHIVGIRLYAGNWVVANNMISITNGTNTNDINVRGMLNDNATGVQNDIIYNSVYIGGSVASGSAGTQAFLRSVAAGNKHINNIYFNNRSGGTGAHVSLASSVTGSWTSNFNLLAARNPAAVAVWNNNPYSFSSFITNSGGDNYSVYADPVNVPPSTLFTGAGTADLTIITSDTTCWYVNGKGVAGPLSNSIADDFGATSVRSTTLGVATDIGADEFTTSVPPPPALASGAPAANTTTTYSFAGQNLASITWGSTGTLPSAIDFRYYSGETPPGPLAGNYSNAYASITATGGTGYTYDITFGYSPAWLGTISSENNVRLAKRDGGVWQFLPTSTVNTSNKTVTMLGLTSFSEFAMTDATNPLPIELTSFTASLRGTSVHLAWRTASELNTLRFEVERRTTGEWETVGSVPARGSVDTPAEYTFVDEHLPLAEIYIYRLKVVYRDGTYEYSNEVRVSAVTADAFRLFANYPNPFGAATTISFTLPSSRYVTVRIVDAAGREVDVVHSGILPEGAHSMLFSARNLAAGVYTCIVTAGGEVRTTPMVRIR